MDREEKLKEQYRKCIDFCNRHQLTSYAEELEQVLVQMDEQPRIMIIGEGKSGKSTLLNALAGKNVAEIDREPKTWCINVYHSNATREYAEFVYQDNSKEEYTIEKAKELADIVEQRTLDVKAPVEIHWYYPDLEWPMQNVLLVDTPGFNQKRFNSSAKKDDDDVYGIELIEDDSFRKYYYKADLVLWCLMYGKTRDGNVNKHLKEATEISDNIRIYGIITKMDKIKDANERYDCFVKDEAYYKDNYPVEDCIQSGLPTIFEKDNEKIKHFKNGIRNSTISIIREKLNFLLRKNIISDKTKLKKAEAFLEQKKKAVGKIVDGILNCYYENYVIYSKALKEYEEMAQSWKNSTLSAIEGQSESIRRCFGEDDIYRRIWRENSGDIDGFSNAMSDVVEEKLQQLQHESEVAIKKLEDLTAAGLDSIEWKTYQANLGDPFSNSQTGYEKKEERSRASIDISMPSRFCFDPNELYYVFSKLMHSWSGNGEGVLSHLAGMANELIFTKKILGASKDSFIGITQSAEKKFIDGISDICDSQKESYNKLIVKEYKKRTGYDPSEVCEYILRTEAEAYAGGVRFEGGKHFAVIKDGKIDTIYSKYLCIPEFAGFKPDTDNVISVFEEQYVRPAADSLVDQILKSQDERLGPYDGKTATDYSINVKGAFSINALRAATRIDLLELEAIENTASFNEVERVYDRMVTNGLKRTQKALREKAKRKEKIIINEALLRMKNETMNSFNTFYNSWLNALNEAFVYLRSNPDYTVLLPGFDPSYYYFNFYLPGRKEDMFLKALWHYRDNNTLIKSFTERYVIFGTNGRKMSQEIETGCKEQIRSLLDMLDKKRREYEGIWDGDVRMYQQQAQSVCDYYYSAIDQFMLSVVRPRWKANGADSGIVEFAVKNKLINKQYIRFLTGKKVLPEVGIISNYKYSDGDTIADKIKQYIVSKLPEHNLIWEGKNAADN